MDMTFELAFDLAAILSKEDKDWSYVVEVNATNRLAKILISDETGHKLGYLGEDSLTVKQRPVGRVAWAYSFCRVNLPL